MPFEALDTLSLIVTITWALLNGKSYVNPTFAHILPSFEHLTALVTLASFTFCTGLFDAVQSDVPPPIQWFEAISADIPQDVWGVYVLVYSKPGCTSYLYVGSATASYRGARARLHEHKVGKMLPWKVNELRKAGYKLSHSALLAHCPIPSSPADHPIYRYLLVAMEAAFACIFWAMWNRQADYGFAGVCPWVRSSFSYRGLCSHSPLKEDVRGGRLNLTSEQLIQCAAITQEKNRQYQYVYQRQLRAEASDEYKARQKRNNEKQKAGTKARQEAAKAQQLYYCSYCNVNCRDASELARHEGTDRHWKKVRMGDSDFECESCNISFKYKSDFNRHKQSKGHKLRSGALD